MSIPKRSAAPTLLLADLGFNPEFDMLCGWRPPKDSIDAGRSRWVTRADFLGEYAIVRAEFLTAHPRLHDGRLPFAERVYQFAQQHGIERLDAIESDEDFVGPIAHDQKGVTL